MRFKDLIKLSDVVMIKFFHDFHLSFHRLTSIWLQQLGLFVDFDCNFLIQGSVQAKSHYGISSLTDTLTDKIVIQVLDRAILGAEFIFSGLAVLEILEHLVLGMSILLFILIDYRFIHDLVSGFSRRSKFIIVITCAQRVSLFAFDRWPTVGSPSGGIHIA